MVALSCAVGSLPSLIAFRNEYGVSIFSPSVPASGETIDSDAPTGVPAYLALICVMSWLYRASAVVSNAVLLAGEVRRRPPGRAACSPR